jgi:hypothetical protein
MADEKEKMVSLMLPESLVRKIQAEASKKERSLGGQIRYILKMWEENDENKK